MCIACLVSRVKSPLLYCEACSEELARELTRLVGKPFDDCGFWELMEKESSNYN
jgi:hypothetical protein